MQKHSISHAIELLQAGKHSESALVCSKILSSDPDNVTALRMLGKIAYQNSEYKESVDYFSRASTLLPADPGLLLDYGMALRLANRPSEAIPKLRQVLETGKTYPALLGLGLAYAAIKEYEEAKILLHESLQLNPKCIISIKRLGSIATTLGDHREAIKWYQRVKQLIPGDIHAYPELIKAHLANGEPGAALELCETCLKIEPACTGVFALKIIALSELGDNDRVDYMFDPNHLLKIYKMECPSSFENMQAFNECFVDHILHHTETSATPEKYTTRNGWQTKNGALFAQNKVFGATVNEWVYGALDKYISELPDDPAHPVNKGKPSSRHIASWGVVLNKEGFQAPHIHPASWLSAVYYIKLPEDFDQQAEKDAGHIVFGQGDHHLHPLKQPQTVTVKPEEGHFVIFPSYFWHHTIPLLSDNVRICLALDLIPSKGWGK